LVCEHCEEGTVWRSRHGGNDPDVWNGGRCEECDGEGSKLCDARHCGETATTISDDGEAFCDGHADKFEDAFCDALFERAEERAKGER
jgi:hypothetical protein